jgi:hypothetical protein
VATTASIRISNQNWASDETNTFSNIRLECIPGGTPTFTPLGPFCAGQGFTLPTTSLNGISGTWTPAVNPNATRTYTFTPTPNPAICASPTTMTVSIVPKTTPTFTQIAPLCAGTSFMLPATSNNNITGSWSPPVNPNATTTYTFTPNPNFCANNTTMRVVAVPKTTPTFMQLGPYCAGQSFSLPITSNNGVTGSWSPPVNPNATTTYTFTPGGSACANTTSMTVAVNSKAPPTFDQIPPVCKGNKITMPVMSKDSVTGIWSPPFNDSVTTTYTFTPNASLFPCAASTTMSVSVVNPVKPVLSSWAICQADTSMQLSGSQSGITGTWSGTGVTNNRFDPKVSGAGAIPLTFTPDPNQCAVADSISVNVTPVEPINTPEIGPACVSSPAFTLPDSIGHIQGVWTLNGSPLISFDPATKGEGNFLLKFTPKPGFCAFPLDVPLSVKPFNAGADRNSLFCAFPNQTMNLHTWLSPGYTSGGTWQLNGIPVANPDVFLLNNLTAGPASFRYILSDPSCGSDTANITLLVALPNHAGKDSTHTICEGPTIPLNLSELVGSADTGGKWTQISGSMVNLADSTKVVVSGLSGSQNVFKYIVPGNVCPSDTSTVTIAVIPYLIAGTDNTATFCAGSQVNLLSHLNTPSSSGDFFNINNTNGLNGNMWNTKGLAEGNYIFQYIITNANPMCQR